MEIQTAILYKEDGSRGKEVALPIELFSLPWNGDLVRQVILGMQANMRSNIAHTKTKSEVSGGGKKPWKQKGTGRARHGSRRSPIWIGGGITFGPRNERDFTQKINKKMRRKALLVALSQKVGDGSLFFAEGLSFDTPSTKEAHAYISKVAADLGFDGDMNVARHNALLVAIPEKNEALQRSLRNIAGITLVETRNLNALSVMNARHIMCVGVDSTLAVISREEKQLTNNEE
jgi:large subunit ribosomal protein L4